MMKIQTRNDGGFTTAWMLGFVLIVFLIGGVFFDVGMGLVERQKFIRAADRAASAGATAIDEQVLIDSNGDNVQLNINTFSGQETAKERCEAVLDDEKVKHASIDRGNSSCEVVVGTGDANIDNQVISVHVRGKKQYGAIMSALGLSEQNFDVTTYARPSCSNSTNPNGDC